MIKGDGPCNRQRMAHRAGPTRTAPGSGRPPRRSAAAPSGRRGGAEASRRAQRAGERLAAVGGVRPAPARAVPRHVGSLHAPDAEMALRNARDLYTRRQEGVSIWVVPAAGSPRPAPTRRTPSSTRPPTRSTGTPPSTTCPRGSSTCEPTPLMSDYVLGSPTTRWSPRSGWAGGSAGAPQLEEDVALANIGLDQLGQARALLAYLRGGRGDGRDEDDLAYLRDEREFRNVQLVELRPGDFGVAMARLLLLPPSRLSCTPRSRLHRRASPGSPARPSRRSPTTSTTPTGSCGSATAPTSRTAGCRPRSTPVWP